MHAGEYSLLMQLLQGIVKINEQLEAKITKSAKYSDLDMTVITRLCKWYILA